MNNIKVTVELCSEDRARLDKILEALSGGKPAPVEPAPVVVKQPEAVEAVTEKPAEPEQVEQTITAADIQRKVIELSAAGKKAQVRDIITTYADKVPDVPESARPEVWAKLIALEG